MADLDEKSLASPQVEHAIPLVPGEVLRLDGTIVNASGHAQEVERNFNLWSIISMGIVTTGSWCVAGGTITVAFYNGGPPGVLYEFIVVTFFYGFVAASIAELASAIPSSAGVYHWASVTAGEYSRVVSFFAGWWNLAAFLFGAASSAAIQGQIIVSMWSLYHPAYSFQRWHVFIVHITQTWVCAAIILYGNRVMPLLSRAALYFLLAGVFISIVVCATMPHTTEKGYASNAFVWKDYVNSTGWSSNGFVFLAGMLNGAFANGTPDVISHLAEEVPDPTRNLPKAIAAQLFGGFVTTFLYLIAILYSINDLEAVSNATVPFPLTEIYRQTTGSPGGSLGLLFLVFVPVMFTGVGTLMTGGMCSELQSESP
ncbi:MAG: hypothetical protein M1828_002521 [Chrysothrix sp. TS-e1954]|nr:MAG: hypothetical protein M1828_002521 [Chrysothrix sp. TS-e1954]